MAIKYSARLLHLENYQTETVALFFDTVPSETLINFIDSLWKCTSIEVLSVQLFDLDTGTVMYEHSCLADEDSILDYNEDAGFDPYMGCYSDDC